MRASIGMLARRTASELALFALGTATFFVLALRGDTSEALAVGMLTFATTSRAVLVMHRAGTLRLAWRHPHVDALGLATPRDGLGWRACDAAEEVLAALSGHARGYREFFPTARADVRAALAGALRPHVPIEDVEATIRALREIGTRLHSVRASASTERPLHALETLAARSQALASAVEELAPRDNVVPIRNGVRS